MEKVTNIPDLNRDYLLEGIDTIREKVESGEIVSYACVFRVPGGVGWCVRNFDGLALSGASMKLNDVAQRMMSDG